MDRLSVASERTVLGKLEWNTPDSPDSYHKDIPLTYYTSPPEPDVSSIKSDSSDLRCSRAEDDAESNIHSRDLCSNETRSVVIPSGDRCPDDRDTISFQQISKNASGFSQSTGGYIMPDELQGSCLSTCSGSASPVQEGHLIESLQNKDDLRDSESDVHHYYSRESSTSPSLLCTSLDEMVYETVMSPHSKSDDQCLSSNPADAKQSSIAMNQDDDGEYEPVSIIDFDRIEDSISSVITQWHSSPHLQTVTATKNQENYPNINTAPDLGSEGYIFMQNASSPQ